MASRGVKRRPQPAAQRVGFGPLVGLRDSLDPSVSNDPKYARVIQNLYPLELDKPTTFAGRPGFAQAGAQLGDTNKRTGQLVCQFTKLDGTEYTVAIVGGQGIYTYDWATDTWTQSVTVANLTTASITLSETARIYAETYTDQLYISDGVNTPFLWDGSTGSGGLTSLTNAPVLYGQQKPYYAKAFGIKNTQRNVLVWSEENDATIGYEQSLYKDSWQLGQTDQEGLVAIAPTNAALYYLRARSTGVINGAVTTDFSTDGNHEGVSQTVGTTSPDAVVVVGEKIYLIDADARPHVIVGGQMKPIFDDIRETIRSLDRAQLSQAIGRYDALTGLVLFGLVEASRTLPSCIIAYNPVLDVPVAIWRGFTFQAMGVVKNADGVPVLMHLSDDGYAYAHGETFGDLWDDELNAGTTAIAHAVESCFLANDTRYEKRYTRTDISLRAEDDYTAINVRHFTPYGSSTAVEGSVTSSESRWDDFNWDEGAWATGVIERHLPVGLNQVGRWIRHRIDHQVTGEKFGFTALSTEYVPAGDSVAAA